MRLFFLLFLFPVLLTAQPDRWQQAVSYRMTIDFDVKKDQYRGQQTLAYTNNSPDTLSRVFYHLYFNAFQPGSMMDQRNLSLADSDDRVGSRISALKPDEIGYIKVLELRKDGRPVRSETVGTILEVELDDAILPGQTVTFDMSFEAQVPLQIRRSGRDNKEGVEYSMAQWYPKMAEYDYQGWHANPYVGREFYGIWGDFDVTINIDRDYVIGGTGYLQGEPTKGKKKTLSHRYLAPNVHDFVWAADPDYKHLTLERANGMTINAYYQPGEQTTENWENLPRVMDEAFNYIEANYGPYPYEQYSFIQGGDGGMEYPMATLITGERNIVSLVGVSVHELMHTWYQMLMGTNEALYPWMDEGFTSWASAEVMNHLRREGLVLGDPVENPHARSFSGLRNFRTSGLQEALSTHADHYNTNAAYGVASYTTGQVFLEQLRYIIGDAAHARTLLRYYNTWKFKHPNPNDFIRIAEKESGMELDWYLEYFVNSVNFADYALTDVEDLDGKGTTRVDLKKIGRMPMPLEIEAKLKDGSSRWFYIAPVILRATKPQPAYAENWTVLKDWPWTQSEYSFEIDLDKKEIESVTINPRGRMFEDDVENNSWSR